MYEHFWNGAYSEREKISFIFGFVLIALSFLILIKPIKTFQARPVSEMTAFVAFEEPLQEPIPEPMAQPVVPQSLPKPVVKTTPVLEKPAREKPVTESVPRSEIAEKQVQEVQESETTSKPKSESAKPVAEAKPVLSQSKPEPSKPEPQSASVSAKYDNQLVAKRPRIAKEMNVSDMHRVKSSRHRDNDWFVHVE